MTFAKPFSLRPDRVNLHLHDIITKHAKELGRGAIVTVAEGGIRIRSLPLKAI